MKIADLRVNGVSEPLGFEVSRPSFSFLAEKGANEGKTVQTRLAVSEGGAEIFAKEGEIDSCGFSPDLPLKPRTRYGWRVAVRTEDGAEASAGSFFETGKMSESWSAKWISAETDAQCLIFSRKFRLERTGAARLYVCALGVYEIYINGAKVGDEYLAPGFHSYDLHLQAFTYDASDFLREGENEIAIWAADGWFKGRLGFDGRSALYGKRLYAIAELFVCGELALATDKNWTVASAPITAASIYDGETYDATATAQKIYETLERTPDGCGAICDRYSLGVRAKENFGAAMLRTRAGEAVLDFAQNITGWVSFDCDLPRGEAIRLTAGEILQGGNFYRENYRTARAQFVYVSDGKKRRVRPHFTFFGFRYMKVEVKRGGGDWRAFDAGAGDFRAIHLRSDTEQTGWIKTGNRQVNRLFENALWSEKDNILDVPTDCPQRDERLGWTGDAQIFAETALYNMDLRAFYRKWLFDMRAEQSLIGGAVPNVVPRLKGGMISEYGSSPWADAACIVPWAVYRASGDFGFLRESYGGMKNWVDYVRRREEAAGGEHLVKDGFHFADWLSLDNGDSPFGATDPLFIASAYYMRCAEIVAAAASVLRYEKDAERYGALARAIKKAICAKYFDSDGLCRLQTQTARAMAIIFHISSDVGAEGRRLRDSIIENDGRLDTGFVGTAMLCPALSESGFHSAAVDLLLREDYPSWLYAVKLGATTIWERWNSVLSDGKINDSGMNSLNHYSYGAIVAWLYKYVCGISADAAGYKSARISPRTDRRLGAAECVLRTASGVYKSAWRISGANAEYEFEIPADCRATIEFEDGTAETCAGGKFRFVKQLKNDF